MFRGIANKREFLARMFEQLGILRLLERTIASRRPGLVVLTYHRIAEPGADLFYDPVISATPENFRAQIEWLFNRVRLLTLEELIRQIESQTPWREPVILITFDDGYRDNFDVAIPILRERNVPATFFIPTAFLDSPQIPWWDQIAYTIKKTQVERLVVERDPNGGSSPLEINLGTTSRTTAIMTVIRAFLDETIPDARWFLEHLGASANVDIDSPSLGRGLFMTWDQVRRLADLGAGLTIGSHAHSHRKLAGLDQETQYDELVSSKQKLETRLSRPIKALAYPYGWTGAYTAETKTLAALAGYHLAFSSQEGVNRFDSFDRFAVGRLGVGRADSAAMLRARCAFYTAFGKSLL
jgi:peptidoglycan/xylan/chitin deacetylase (PgdA/CDA1 family)